ncbi:hypothetical protein [uncultured Legionella sp.]|uniref:hypothetical protein n=1 Tax=uncultured Legionella sp. TaxID=210934 RepID=UPI00262DD212|nr:hypothetical protein [uncultured Legionella sp.]
MPNSSHFFPKTSFFINQKTPDPQKNFFENYSDHLGFLIIKFEQKFLQLQQMDSAQNALHFISKEALRRLNMFEQLRDRYDYFDEILGATALPALCLITSIASLSAALWESTQALAIKTGFTRNDNEDHLTDAGGFLLISVASILFSIASLLKSAISIVTRPIVTALQGYAEQDEDRFHNEESMVGRVLFG